MSTLRHEILINASVEKVFATLNDLESVRFYNPLVSTVAIISPNKTGVGSARHCVFKDGKFAKEKVTASIPNQSISFDLYEHQWPLAYMRWTNRLHQEGTQTRLIADTEYAPSMGIIGKLMDALMMKRQFGKIITQSLTQMKTHIEAQP
jgi:ribosome-associated toxin RatA of RatAB toxin-antitoxin module